MKFQLFEDMKTTIRLNPNAPHALKIKAIEKPLEVGLEYDGEGMLRVLILKDGTRTPIKVSKWTNSYKVLTDFVEVNKVKLAEYKGDLYGLRGN